MVLMGNPWSAVLQIKQTLAVLFLLLIYLVHKSEISEWVY